MNSNLNDLFAVLITIIVTLNGISIPISYNIIASSFKEYLDKDIYRIFIETKEFRANVNSSLRCLFIFLLPLIFNWSANTSFTYLDLKTCLLILYLIFCGFMLVEFFYAFIQFSLTLYKYSANTDEVVFEKIKTQMDAFLEK